MKLWKVKLWIGGQSGGGGGNLLYFLNENSRKIQLTKYQNFTSSIMKEGEGSPGSEKRRITVSSSEDQF